MGAAAGVILLLATATSCLGVVRTGGEAPAQARKGFFPAAGAVRVFDWLDLARREDAAPSQLIGGRRRNSSDAPKRAIGRKAAAAPSGVLLHEASNSTTTGLRRRSNKSRHGRAPRGNKHKRKHRHKRMRHHRARRRGGSQPRVAVCMTGEQRSWGETKEDTERRVLSGLSANTDLFLVVPRSVRSRCLPPAHPMGAATSCAGGKACARMRCEWRHAVIRTVAQPSKRARNRTHVLAGGQREAKKRKGIPRGEPCLSAH